MNDNLMKTYRFRPGTLDDIPRLCELVDLVSMQLRGIKTADPNEMRTEMTIEGYDMPLDTMAVTLHDGTLMAFFDHWCVEAPYVRQFFWPMVHPDLQGDEDLFEAMMAFLFKRSEEKLALAPVGTKVTLGSWVDELDTWLIGKMEQYSITHKRDFARMRIDMDAPPAEPVWPEGLRLKTWEFGADDRALWEAKNEAFMDHWGHVEGNHDEDFARWMKFKVENPHFKPELHFMVMDGDEIAAVCLCEDYVPEDEGMAYVGTVGVRRPWRKRGLAAALLTHSFRELSQLGKKSVVLYVDTDSLTNANRLYEKVGMRKEQVHRVYEKILRDGEDLVTQELN